MKYLLFVLICFVLVAGCLGGGSSDTQISKQGPQSTASQTAASMPVEPESPSLSEKVKDSFASLLGSGNAKCTYTVEGQSMDVWFLNNKFKVVDPLGNGVIYDGNAYWVWQGSEGYKVSQSFIDKQGVDMPTQQNIMSVDDYAEAYAGVDLDCTYNVVSTNDIQPPSGIEWQDLEEMMADTKTQLGAACQQCLSNAPDPTVCDQVCSM
ncbi:MAG: hypothetical protein ABH950_04225 [Candidatus Altiarchaeota archaeon]